MWKLFESIDRNRNGEIDKGELRVAFAKAGVTVSNAKLDEFFAEVDTNRDGVISYEEWRYEFLCLVDWKVPLLTDPVEGISCCFFPQSRRQTCAPFCHTIWLREI